MTAKSKHTKLAPLIDEDGEVRELTDADFAQMRHIDEIPELAGVAEMLRNAGKLGRPPLPEEDRKQRVTMYLDRDVVARLKEDGRGWQTRANAKLREVLGLE